MNLDHVAIWTKDIERLREFYVKYPGGSSNEKYYNSETGFQRLTLVLKSNYKK